MSILYDFWFSVFRCERQRERREEKRKERGREKREEERRGKTEERREQYLGDQLL